MPYDVTSPSNERIKRLIRLRDRRHRDAENVFVVEGRRLLGRSIEKGLEPLEVYVDGSIPDLDLPNAVTVDPTVLSRASYRQQSEGVIAVFSQYPLSLESLNTNATPLLLAAESLEKPGNLGAMLRTADACGADAFIAVGDTVDVFNPNVIRASTGAFFTVPVATATLSELKRWLADRPIRLIGASTTGEKTLWEADMTGAILLMVGAEDVGLSMAAREMSDSLISIPMSGAVDSLNASVSLALLAFEATRQRSH
jgi:TrmH family RNA methyltransferase